MDSGKHRVTLTRREEWRTWLNSVRAVATSYEAWDLVDPDKEADRRPKRAKKPQHRHSKMRREISAHC